MTIATLLESFQPVRVPADAEAMRPAVREFAAGVVSGLPLAARARSWTGWDADVSRAIAARGWLGLTMPTALGGAGLTPWHRFVVVEELLTAGVPIAAHWIGDRQSAPVLLRFGSAAQQERFIPAICRSELFFCIGMSEPDAGSDLAGVRTRAVRADGGWRLNGRKIWTTHAHRADWMMALVRTEGTVDDRQRGLSQMLVDLKAPGVSIRPIPLLTGDAEFSEVLFEDVWVPEGQLVGREGEGWQQVTPELAFERSGPERIYSSILLLDHWVRHLGGAASDGDAALVGRLMARLATLRAMSVALTGQLAAGRSPVVEAAMLKDLGTAFEQALPLLLADRLGADPDVPTPAPLADAVHFLLQLMPAFSLRGGTREIMRGMIARGMGLR